MDKLRVYKTGHQIADTVADAFIAGNYAGDADLVYGILRHDVFSRSNSYFEVDRGYWGANHFDGTYRISYKGTQAKWHDDIPQKDIDFKLEDWRDPSRKEWIMLVPPTEHVARFFNVDIQDWTREAIWSARLTGKTCFLRTKDCDIPLEEHLATCAGVITFNSSIGWQALQRGIPVYSDPDHSIIGSYYKAKLKNPIDFLSEEYKQVDREPLFKSMRAHQFTLAEISEGKATPLIEHYLNERRTSGLPRI